jgi:phytoene dehydrogenase-like protein
LFKYGRQTNKTWISIKPLTKKEKAMDKSIIVIGAGIAGLSTGCYARMNGYGVKIFETHDKPGGMCTSWKRKDYTFDYCIHNLVGTLPLSGTNQIWLELGALDDIEIINRDEFTRIDSLNNESVHWYTDLDRLQQHLNEIAPEDSRVTGELIKTAQKLAGVDLFAMELGGFWRTLKALPYVSLINHWSQITIGQFAGRFKNPFLRRAIKHVMYDIPGDSVPMTAIALFMAGLARGDLGWPMGGSLAFSQRIEKRLLDLGGEIHYKTPVEKILVENNRAVGIRLADGSEHRADYIISAADGYSTIYKMLEGKYLTEPIEKYYGDVEDTGPFGFIVFLGLEEGLHDLPHALALLLDEPLDTGGMEQNSIYLDTFGPETGLVPEGKSIIKIEVQAQYSYWKKLRDADLHAYREEKKQVAGNIINHVANRFPWLKDKISIMDTSTPPTCERYTGNLCGWQPGPPKENINEIQRKGLSKTLPGLGGFFHVGQWAYASIGISSVAITGRSMVSELCKLDKKRFITNT